MNAVAGKTGFNKFDRPVPQEAEIASDLISPTPDKAEGVSDSAIAYGGCASSLLIEHQGHQEHEGHEGVSEPFDRWSSRQNNAAQSAAKKLVFCAGSISLLVFFVSFVSFVLKIHMR